MNITKKIITGVSGAALAGVLIFGAAASAAGSTSGVDGALRPRAAYVCAHQSEVGDRLAKANTRIEQRIATLTARRAQADQAGNTDAVTRIDKRLAQLNTRDDRVTKRAAQLPAWIAAHCDAAG